RVGRKLAEHAARPVQVLHAAIAVVPERFKTEHFAHALVPRLGEVCGHQRTIDERLLQLETQYNVAGVGSPVRSDADESGFYAAELSKQVVGFVSSGISRRRIRKRLRDERRQEFQECSTSPKLHLGENLLPLMQTGTASSADRLIEPLRRKALLVPAMP